MGNGGSSRGGLISGARKVFAYREFSVLLILLLEFLLFYVIIDLYLGREYDRNIFFTGRNIHLILRFSSFYAIASVGAAMIIISAGIDLAPGSVMALTAVVTGYFYVYADWSLTAACSMGMLVGITCGALASFMIVDIKLPPWLGRRLPARVSGPIQGFLGIQLMPFIATLGIMGIARGLAYILMQGKTFIDLSAKIPRDQLILGYRFIDILRISPIFLTVVIALFFHWFMTRTSWGRQIYAVGGNEIAASFSGVKVPRMKTVVYMAGGVLASISGLILAVVEGQAQQSMALGYELDIIAAAVVGGASLTGGRGSVLGAVIGALIFGVLRNALNKIPGAAYYERFIVGLAVVIIVIIDQFTARRQSRMQ